MSANFKHKLFKILIVVIYLKYYFKGCSILRINFLSCLNILCFIELSKNKYASEFISQLSQNGRNLNIFEFNIQIKG